MPTLVVEMVPDLVVEIVPILVVEMVPDLVVEIVPLLAKAGEHTAITNTVLAMIALRLFMVLLLVLKGLGRLELSYEATLKSTFNFFLILGFSSVVPQTIRGHTTTINGASIVFTLPLSRRHNNTRPYLANWLLNTHVLTDVPKRHYFREKALNHLGAVGKPTFV